MNNFCFPLFYISLKKHLKIYKNYEKVNKADARRISENYVCNF